MDVFGIVQTIIFRNTTNGYSVLSVLPDNEKRPISAVGILPLLDVGDHVRLQGEFAMHARFGQQFQVTEYERIAPSTAAAMEAYLSSGVVRGVGKHTAKAIVAQFGIDTLYVMEHTPERLIEVAGIGKKKAAMITESFCENNTMRNILLALEPYGITVNQAYRMFKVYGELSLAKVQENPYQLIEDIDGIGFLTADRIARNVAGFETDSLARLVAGIRYTLQRARDEQGDMYLPRSILLEQSARLLGADPVLLNDTVDWMLSGGELTADMSEDLSDAVYLPYLAKIEDHIARRLVRLSVAPPQRIWDVRKMEHQLGLELSAEQRETVLTALNSGLLIITGGPGTGKTTIIRFIATAFAQEGLEVALAAPTGRAAKRMNEATGFEASTIHRLLEFIPGEGFLRNRENPLGCDMLIVDEMSMVDAPLFHSLLQAISPSTQLILVGDSDQLPPVGCGQVLLDMIHSDYLPVRHLSEIFRQAQKSMIVKNAHRINHGERPDLSSVSDDFQFEESASADRIRARIGTLILNERSRLKSEEPLMDVQVLVPMKSGPLGTVELNKYLQQVLNPANPYKSEFTYGETVYREGDKVMQIKNDYKMEWKKQDAFGSYTEGIGVFNGDLGTIWRLDTEFRTATVIMDDGRVCTYDFKGFDCLDHAYCITIHKSQGSEFSTVLLPLLSGPPMLLTRNLLYTAVTRAKKLVYCIGRKDSFHRMVANAQRNERRTLLSLRIRTYASLQDLTVHP